MIALLLLAAVIPLSDSFFLTKRSINAFTHISSSWLGSGTSSPPTVARTELPGCRKVAEQLRGGGRFIKLRGGGGRVVEVSTLADVDRILEEAGDKLVVLDFYADWCGPCQIISPLLDVLSEEREDVVFLKVDVDENAETAERYEVYQMPTFVFVKAGEVVDQFSGANAEILRQKVEELSQGKEGEGAGALGLEELTSSEEIDDAGQEVEIAAEVIADVAAEEEEGSEVAEAAVGVHAEIEEDGPAAAAEDSQDYEGFEAFDEGRAEEAEWLAGFAGESESEELVAEAAAAEEEEES